MDTGMQPTVPTGVPTLHGDRVQQSGNIIWIATKSFLQQKKATFFVLFLPWCQFLPQQKTDCESRWEEDGYGGKKWVEVPSTCQQNNYDTCRDVQKQKLVQVEKMLYTCSLHSYPCCHRHLFSSRFRTLTARMCLSRSARRCLSNSASRSPTQPPSRCDPHTFILFNTFLTRFARMCTGRSRRG